MEELKQTRLVQFLHDICIFSGCILWGVIILVVFFDYQVGWKRSDSINETVINQVNQEVLTANIIAEQEANSKKRR